ncbi:MAG: divalent cation tolerance protein CutA [Pseudomonadota bacterium]
MSRICEVSVTYHEKALAQVAAKKLFELRLAAVAHVGEVETTFRWDGAIQVASEWRLTVRITEAAKDSVIAGLTADHPYELPGFVIHTCETTAESAAWIASQIAG